MTQSITTKYDIEDRQYQLIELLKQGLTHEQAAKQLRICRATLERDLKDISTDEKKRRFYDLEWLKLYGARVNNNLLDVEAFRALTSLIRRSGDQVITQNNITAIKVSFGSKEENGKVSTCETTEYSVDSASDSKETR